MLDGEDLDPDEIYQIVRQAVHRSDPCGLLIRGSEPSVYDQEIKYIVQRIVAGELLLPSLIADAFRSKIQQIDPEDIREITRQIGLGLGFG